MKFLDILASILLIIGGLNWGLIAAADFDLVAAVCGTGTTFARVIYGLIGVSAIYRIACWKSSCKTCY